jgi:CBS domain-containing protein
LIFEALMSMMKDDIRHLAVMDATENVVGILSSRDLLSAQGQSPLFVLREISEAGSMAQIIDRNRRMPQLLRSLITSGAKAQNLTRFITAVSDAILKKVMAFTLEELGQPPARFVFMIMGSEGRHEQTLKTDQDNAIVYEDVDPKDEPATREYFLKFGEKACTLLDQAGFEFCTGGVMAKNPKWCQSLSTWKAYFSAWIHAAEPEDLLQASIFFDFRHGFGEPFLINALRQHLFDSLEGWSGFFRHLTENALHFKPPIGFFRNFVVESKGKHRSALDIKSAMTPIVDFVRIYALKHKIEQTNTLERLSHLQLKKVITAPEYDELEKAYGFLMQLRFVRQVTAVIDEKTAPNNYINPKKLTNIEQKMLKEIFKRIEKFQTKLEFEFTGLV